MRGENEKTCTKYAFACKSKNRFTVWTIRPTCTEDGAIGVLRTRWTVVQNVTTCPRNRRLNTWRNCSLERTAFGDRRRRKHGANRESVRAITVRPNRPNRVITVALVLDDHIGMMRTKKKLSYRFSLSLYSVVPVKLGIPYFFFWEERNISRHYAFST